MPGCFVTGLNAIPPSKSADASAWLCGCTAGSVPASSSDALAMVVSPVSEPKPVGSIPYSAGKIVVTVKTAATTAAIAVALSNEEVVGCSFFLLWIVMMYSLRCYYKTSELVEEKHKACTHQQLICAIRLSVKRLSTTPEAHQN